MNRKYYDPELQFDNSKMIEAADTIIELTKFYGIGEEITKELQSSLESIGLSFEICTRCGILAHKGLSFSEPYANYCSHKCAREDIEEKKLYHYYDDETAYSFDLI